ncbi:MAG: DNA polymerase I [Oscillospiraceae bacterium]
MKLMILDGNSIVNRAYYGIRMLTSPDGTPTNGVYGFMTILNRLLSDEKPDAVCVAFDLKAPTFRHKQFEGYKAQRKEMPDELAAQLPLLREALDAMGIKRLELEGWEADDIMGTVSVICQKSGWACLLVTGDKDSFQLITETSTVKHVKTRMGQQETISYTPEVFFAEYGFEPKHLIDLKALMGDASDNIPGVRGVGEKTAMALIQTFGTLQNVYDNLDSEKIKPTVRKKLEEGRESAYLSYDLATIRCDAPIDFKPEDCVHSAEYGGKLYNVFKRLGFVSLITQWGVRPGEDASAAGTAIKTIEATEADMKRLAQLTSPVAVLPIDGLDAIELTADGETVYILRWAAAGEAYNALLKAIFSENIPKITHNAKELMRLLMAEGLPAGGFISDTALEAYLLEATENNYELNRLTAKYLGAECSGAAAIYRLEPVLREKLRNNDQESLLEDMELPLCAVLAEMESVGFRVDKKALYAFGESLNSGIEELQNGIWAMAGEDFNINSPKQLGTILFDKLMLPSGKKTKTGWSTNADVLEKLRGKHPIIEAVLDYRGLTKLKSTYADGLLKVIESDGRIHTSFQMTVTATGRLSSTEPNLQNIPIRKQIGGEVRKMFVASPGKVLVDADYSQIELRLLAHISGDETMKAAFLSGEDIHAVTASQVFGVPLAEVTSLQRSRAKAVNFGIVYGISAFSLAQDIGVYQNEAKAYIDAYLEKYHGVREYMKTIVEKAKADGYVETLYHRRRYLPELKSSNYNLRAFGERVALNMPIQGTAADVIKLAMINVSRRLKTEGLDARLILQVHDELIAECPEAEAETVKKILAGEMQNVAKLSVPLTAEAHSGKSWYEAK